MKDQDGPQWMCEVHALKITHTYAERARTRAHVHTQDEGAGMGQSGMVGNFRRWKGSRSMATKMNLIYKCTKFTTNLVRCGCGFLFILGVIWHFFGLFLQSLNGLAPIYVSDLIQGGTIRSVHGTIHNTGFTSTLEKEKRKQWEIDQKKKWIKLVLTAHFCPVTDLLACYPVPGLQIHIYTPLKCWWFANQLHLVKKMAKNYKSTCLVHSTANL